MPLTNLGAKRCIEGPGIAPSASSIWLSLHSAEPLDGDTEEHEITDSDFPRIEITTAERTVVNNVLTVTVEQDPTDPTADVGMASHWGVYDASTGGNLMAYGPIQDASGNDTTLNIISGSDVRVLANGTTITIPLS